MKDNPVFPLAKRYIREYQKQIGLSGKRMKKILDKHKPSINNQAFLRKWINNLSGDITKYTQKMLVEAVEEVIEVTLDVYNKNHKGDKLTKARLDELKMEIYKDFLLSSFKGATIDTRISTAEKRLKVNLFMELNNLINGLNLGSKHYANLINSITGKEYKQGGTAYRWNSRLVLSEIFRAYQFTARRVLGELGVERVSWVNSPRHEEKDSLIDNYSKQEFTPSTLPDYPYPCNDSYFIPIYES